VRAAVKSALEQTYARIELIVFDNGSTDGSRAELESLRDRYRFTLILQDNVGLVRALNQALAMAKGKYFAGLATDDVWLADKIARQVAYLEANPRVEMIGGQVDCIDADGNPTGPPLEPRPGEATFADLMSWGCSVYGPTIMCRISTLREIGGFDESLRIEDYSLALRLTHEKRRVVVLPDVFTLYRRHGSNWTGNSIESDLVDIGARYRSTPEYRDFYHRFFPLAFYRLVVEGQKRRALRVLVSEPIPWTWSNAGRGLLRMAVPYVLVRAYRSLRFKRANTKGIA
jgi:glycosyltransferase involved in cell wall biosynthesis